MKLLSSLVLAATLATGCVTTKDTVKKPTPVESQLDRAKVRDALAARRQVAVEHFLMYREARVYPINNQGGLRHMWFDDLGHLCAAATLISWDWGAEPTKHAVKDRQIALATVKKGPIADWILTSGLTHHEIVAIQAPAIDIGPEDRSPEIARLYAMYTDVERQLTTLADESLDEATDALMKRPDLAKKLLDGTLPQAPSA
jgi:hypothetical protein